MAASRLTILLACAALPSCSRSNQVDVATVDRGSLRQDVRPRAAMAVLTLPGGTRLRTTDAVAALAEYLSSTEPPGRTFALPSISFVKGLEVREDPNGTLASLASVLNAFPKAHAIVEVAMPSPRQSYPSPVAEGRAAQVLQRLVANGGPMDRLSIAGVQSGMPDTPPVSLRVVGK